jgi:hypothetical protein
MHLAHYPPLLLFERGERKCPIRTPVYWLGGGSYLRECGVYVHINRTQPRETQTPQQLSGTLDDGDYSVCVTIKQTNKQTLQVLIKMANQSNGIPGAGFCTRSTLASVIWRIAAKIVGKCLGLLRVLSLFYLRGRALEMP